MKFLLTFFLSGFLSLYPIKQAQEADYTVTFRMAEVEDIFNILPEPNLAMINTERYCLVQAIYFEARNQSLEGQLAVAHVVLNRTKHSKYPDSICGVVFQNKQFSFTHDGRSDYMFERQPRKNAEKISVIALEGMLPDPTNGATSYHADYANPYWKKKLEPTKTIDNHQFYKGF